MPWVTKNAVASDNASPIQPVFHSQSFLLQMSDVGVPRLAVGPGTKTMQTRKMMAAGITSETTTSSQVGIISDVWKGYDMSRLTRENGRLKGVRYSQPAPTAAIALRNCQSWFDSMFVNAQLLHASVAWGQGSSILQDIGTRHLTYMMHIQSKMYDSTSRTDGILRPLGFDMTAERAAQR